jgi:hypothetical protein
MRGKYSVHTKHTLSLKMEAACYSMILMSVNKLATSIRVLRLV